MKKITTKSTSKHTQSTDDIVLRQTEITRLIFRPLIVENKNNPEASVKGWFIFQRKGINDGWREYKTLDLNQLKKGEWVKLELKSKTVLKLLKNLEYLKGLYEQYGINYGEKEFYLTDQNIGALLSQLSEFGEDKTETIVKALRDLTKEELDNFDKVISVVSLVKIKNVLQIWNSNKNNPDEEYWKNIFKKYTWILSQVFACPYIFIGDEYYFGGKRGNNKGGVYGDFLYKNKLTGNVAFIEIKTPETSLIGKQYRGENDNHNNTVYSMSNEMTGGINQVLNQRGVFKQKQDSLEESDTRILNSKCILIAGKVSDLKDGEKRSFDLFRNNVKDGEIISYDELFGRIGKLLEVFNGKNENSDIPFY
jgi:hypothetical protein